jgi:hypothetical protein
MPKDWLEEQRFRQRFEEERFRKSFSQTVEVVSNEVLHASLRVCV